MNTRHALLSALFLAIVASLHAASSDIAPPSRRKVSVDQMASLASPAPVAVVKDDIPNPFSPAGFGQPDAEELAARLAAKSASSQAPRTLTDRELLNRIAEKLTPGGSLRFNGEQVLTFPRKRLKKGDRFVITYDGRDYELELTDVQPSSFSVRYNNIEITRPIKLGKNQ